MIEIIILHQMENFPLCGSHFIEQMPEVIKVNYGKTPLITTATLSRFFNYGGLLAMVIDDKLLIGLATLIRSVEINVAVARIGYVSVRHKYEGKVCGQEIDSHLVCGLIDRARQLNIKSIDVACDPSNRKAARLFGSLGFKVRDVSSRRLTFADSEESQQVSGAVQEPYRID